MFSKFGLLWPLFSFLFAALVFHHATLWFGKQLGLVK